MAEPAADDRKVIEELRVRFEGITEQLTPEIEPATTYSAHVRLTAEIESSAE